jgi:hypothetical protein
MNVMNKPDKPNPFKMQYKINKKHLKNEENETVSRVNGLWYAFILIVSIPLPWLGLPFYIVYKNDNRKIHPYLLATTIFGAFVWILIFILGLVLLTQEFREILDYYNR